ncbi:MAG: DUF1624 domain-containing protein, partial [Paucibacter sp.]|nr:DUF1624 domain-containing protein [Roseateles sp.]
MSDLASSSSASQRFSGPDALRGLAMLWMTAFHFSFDLNYFGFIHQDFYRNPLWTGQRSLIVSLFLLCAGMGQAVAVAQAQSWPRFWRRWVQIAGCALLVSVGSWWMFPASFISFGVLHGMALMLIVVRVLAPRCPNWLLLLAGLAALWVHPWYSHPFFDSRWTNWTGLVTHLPITEDYVPILPWLGPMLWGYALARALMRRRPHWLDWGQRQPVRALARLGQWSLSYYMVHQPVLLGLLALAATMR